MTKKHDFSHFASGAAAAAIGTGKAGKTALATDQHGWGKAFGAAGVATKSAAEVESDRTTRATGRPAPTPTPKR